MVPWHSTLTLALAIIIPLELLVVCLALWTRNRLSTPEFLGLAALVVAFLFLLKIPFGGYFSILLLAVPPGYLLYAIVEQRRLTAALRRQDYAKCDRVLARDPRNAAALVRLAELLDADGRHTEALETYRQALEIDPLQGTVRYRFTVLEEQLALTESRQVRCPGCRTIHLATEATCWKCGRVLHARHAAGQRLRTLITRNRPAVILLGVAALLLLVTLMVSPMGWPPLLHITGWLGVILGVGALCWLAHTYLGLLEEEDQQQGTL